MMMEKHSHKEFWLAIVGLAIVAIVFLVATAWLLNEQDSTQAQFTNMQAELTATKTDLAVAEIELDATKGLVDSLEATLSNLDVNYARLTTGYGYVLRDPDYQEMKRFLAEDGTSEQEYLESAYTCVDFAADIKANAAEEGIRCAYVIIEYVGGSGHAAVAFDTTDNGLVFIEPQFDWEVEPQIGRRYYQCVRPPLGHIMAQPAHDDTIMRIIIVW